MRAQEFLKRLHTAGIVAAVRHAESHTSGQIGVFISRKPADDPVGAAQAAFLRLGMEKTNQHNAVLIFVAPLTHRFAVIGDAAVHQQCGDAFWQELAKTMSGYFRRSEFSEGILHGVKTAGELLAKHFPRRRDGGNELPDSVAHD